MIPLDIPTPSPVPTPSATPYSLSDQINIATRPAHSKLNRLILARLPLALPPHTTNPSVYISGLLYIAPIYATFETLWSNALNAPKLPTGLTKLFDICDPAFQPVDGDTPADALPGIILPSPAHPLKVCSRTNALLSHVRLPGLLRAGRLRADIRVLTDTPEHELDERIDAASQNGKVAEFIAHTTHSVEGKPHVLLAYAWVLYMALFSGGRYLRASLQEAGGADDFWQREPSPVRTYSMTSNSRRERRASESSAISTVDPAVKQPRRQPRSESRPTPCDAPKSNHPALQFFNFIGDQDGEDLKREFKQRITEAEMMLTDGEKDDIIEEAKHIFAFMIELVTELDTVIGGAGDGAGVPSDNSAKRSSRSNSPTPIPTPVTLPIPLGLQKTRDSFFLTRDRLANDTTAPNQPEDLTPPTTPLAFGESQSRRLSDLQMFFADPVAKIVRFNETVQDGIVRRISGHMRKRSGSDGRVSRDGRDVDGGGGGGVDEDGLSESVENLLRGVITLLPVLGLAGILLAWFCVA